MATRPSIEQQITWVYTEDLAGTTAFYRDSLALEMVLAQSSCNIFLVTAGSFLGVCFARPGRHVEPRGVVLTFVTPDVDGWHERLQTAGASVEGPPERHDDFMVYCFFARDPNGYLLEFQSFLDPAWQAGGRAAP